MARDYEVDRSGMRQLLAGREMKGVCLEVAEHYVPIVAAATPRDTGDTAATTRAELTRGHDGRAAAVVAQDGAGVPQNFGNGHVPAQHHLERALGNS